MAGDFGEFSVYLITQGFLSVGIWATSAQHKNGKQDEFHTIPFKSCTTIPSKIQYHYAEPKIRSGMVFKVG